MYQEKCIYIQKGRIQLTFSMEQIREYNEGSKNIKHESVPIYITRNITTYIYTYITKKKKKIQKGRIQLSFNTEQIRHTSIMREAKTRRSLVEEEVTRCIK